MSAVMCTSPQLSRYRAIFALEKRRRECHSVLRHSFDLLATHRRSGQVHMLKSKLAQSMFMGHISFEDGTKFFALEFAKTHKYGRIFARNPVDCVILFVLGVVLAGILCRDLYPAAEH